jgi:hypothetical protein
VLGIELLQDTTVTMVLHRSKRPWYILFIRSNVKREAGDGEGLWLRWQLYHTNNEKYPAHANTVLCMIKRAEYFKLFRRGGPGPAAVDEHEIENDIRTEVSMREPKAISVLAE